MIGDWKSKKDYKKFTDEALGKELKDFKYQIMLGYAGHGKAKIGDKADRGSHGSDILKRLRKEKAKVLTEIRRRESQGG